MENLQKQREKMKAHKEALIKKIINVLKGETSEDALDIICHAQHHINTSKNKTTIK